MDRITSPFSIQQKFRTKLKKHKLKKNALDKVDFEEEKRRDPKYKTELCKSFMEDNFCQYGNKCRFAHGEEELVIKEKNNNYKKKLCKSFYKEGFCTYGIRCNFQHDQRKLSDMKLSLYYINLIIFPRPKLFHKKRLKIFEELSSIENNLYNLSESTISNSIDNSPNTKKKLEEISEFCPEDSDGKMNFNIKLDFDKVYQKEDEMSENSNEKNLSEDEKNFFLFSGINLFDLDKSDSEDG